MDFNLFNIIFGERPLTWHSYLLFILPLKQYLFLSLMLKKVLTLIGFLCHLKVKFKCWKYAEMQRLQALNS